MVEVLAIVCLFGLPVWFHHQRKMAEMRMGRGDQAGQGLMAEMLHLRSQMAELRDTTTKYDMSFDSALQRIESRTGNLEERMTAMEQAKTTVSSRTP